MAKKKRIVDIRLTGAIADAPARFAFAARERVSVYELETALWRAASDDGVAGVRLSVHDPSIGWSKAESLHRALLATRKRGKCTLAYVTGADNVAYFMASACETIVVAPSAMLPLHALSSEKLFFKDVLTELGVDPQLEAVGEYKSAGEPFTRRGSSGSHREETLSLLNDLNDQFTTRIAEARGLSIDAVAAAVGEGPFLPEDAVAAGLVDLVEPEDFCETHLEEVLSAPVRFVPLARYHRPPAWWKRLLRWRRPRVAVVHATGMITSGDGSGGAARGTAGARSLSELIAKLRSHRRVRAVVLRIESPGGGALASDVIHRELVRTAEEKPVVVSMGDVAASGGYYIASAASAVLAEGTTLTGSIGVIGGKVVVQKLMHRLGVVRESMALGANADTFSSLRPFTQSELSWYRRFIEHFYRSRFLAVVSEGRGMTIEEADAAGRGRVWTGRQARDVGLVDELGGLHDAIELAHERAGLSRRRSRVILYGRRARLKELVPPPSIWSDVFGTWQTLEELAREELLLLMPRWFRIR